MSADPKALYQEVILDHNKKPRNYGTLDHASHRPKGSTRCVATTFTWHSMWRVTQ